MGSQLVLVVEDDPVARELLRTFLQSAGFAVACAGNGREALDVLRAGDRPAVILLDLKMPVMSGWQFREEQRRDPALAKIPVVVFSGGDELDSAAASLGAAAHFPKPIDPEELVATVRKLAAPGSPAAQ
jgi:CheY-like chemotaxis protein